MIAYRSLFSSAPVLLCLVACGGAKARPAANAHAANEAAPAPSRVVTTTGATAERAFAKVTSAVNEAEVRAFLEARPGEESAEDAPIPGVREPSAEERAILAKCSAAREKALARTAKQPAAKQMSAVFKAMDADKRCLDLGLREQTQANAKTKDLRAQTQMRVLAQALSRAGACGEGAPNPAPSLGACFLGTEPMLLDREGWTCLAKQLSPEDREALEGGAAYVFGFKVDAKLGVFELVGRGCQLLLGTGGGPNAETELVLRGKLGEPVDQLEIYRRAPTDAKKDGKKKD